jgi:hypothetical protein
MADKSSGERGGPGGEDMMEVTSLSGILLLSDSERESPASLAEEAYELTSSERRAEEICSNSLCTSSKEGRL